MDGNSAYRSIFEGLRDPAILLDGNRDIFRMNRAAVDLFGDSALPWLGDLIAAHAAKDAAKTESDIEIDTLLGTRSFRAALSRAPGGGGTGAGTVVILTDTTESRKAEEMLRRVNRALRTVGRCNEAVVHAVDETLFLCEVCRIIVEEGGYLLAWVGYAMEDEGKTVRPAAQAGYEDGYLERADISWAGSGRGQGPTGTAIRENKVSVVKDILSDPRFAPWRAEAHARGYSSAIAIPLTTGAAPLGALTIYDREPDAFDREEVKLLADLAENVAFGIMSLRSREENRKGEEERRKLAALVENSSDLIAVIASGGRVTYLNRSGRSLVGAGGVGESGEPGIRSFIMEEDRSQYGEIAAAVRTRGSWNGEFRLRDSRTGLPIPVELNAFPIRDPKTGLQIATAAVARDIRERKLMEEEILKAQKLESIGILAGGIAHDFNNLLMAVLGNLSLSKMHVGRETPVYEKLAEAEKAAFRARDLTRQLLTFSQGGSPVRKRSSIGEIVRDSAGFAMSGSKARIEFSVPGDLWPAEVDGAQIGQVVQNLVLNAVQSMPEGGTIRISCENAVGGSADASYPEAGRYVRISIADQGIGIPRKHLTKIFDPYFTTKQVGSGLGLAVTHSIVRKHGGHVTVESETGVGTTFHVYLPASEGRPAEKPALPETLPRGRGRVLVMDDDESVRNVVGEMLGTLGYDHAVARDGSEAIRMYQEARGSGRPFDVVIMDLTIPGGMGGREAVVRLHELDPEATVIVSSGYSNDPVMADYAKHGFSGLVPKPYNLKELGQALDAFMQDPP